MQNSRIIEDYEENEEQILRSDANEIEKNIFLKRNGYNILKRLVALALLKPDQIMTGYNFIKSCCAEENKKLMKPIFTYFENYWLNIIKPDNFNVYGMNVKTNNVAESYHSQWREHVQKHPFPSQFIGDNRNHIFIFTFKKKII